MINSILWVVTLTYNIGAIFYLRRTFNRLTGILKTINKDVSKLKLDTHRAVNSGASNAMNIQAHHAEWKALHAQNVEMYSSRLNYATNEGNKRMDEFEEKVKDVVRREFKELEEAMHAHHATSSQQYIEFQPYLDLVRDLQEKLERLDVDLAAMRESSLDTLPKLRGRLKKDK